MKALFRAALAASLLLACAPAYAGNPNLSGTPATTASTNINKWNGNTVSTGNGTTDAGTERITISSDSTAISTLHSDLTSSIPSGTNTIGNVVPVPNTSGGLSIKRLQVANNTTSVAVDASAGQLYGIEAFNNSSTIAYIKLYNTAQGSTTCGSNTGNILYSAMIPGNTGGAGYISMNTYGLPFSTAITACVTTGYADADTTAPAATTYTINFFYK